MKWISHLYLKRKSTRVGYINLTEISVKLIMCKTVFLMFGERDCVKCIVELPGSQITLKNTWLHEKVIKGKQYEYMNTARWMSTWTDSRNSQGLTFQVILVRSGLFPFTVSEGILRSRQSSVFLAVWVRIPVSLSAEVLIVCVTADMLRDHHGFLFYRFSSC